MTKQSTLKPQRRKKCSTYQLTFVIYNLKGDKVEMCFGNRKLGEISKDGEYDFIIRATKKEIAQRCSEFPFALYPADKPIGRASFCIENPRLIEITEKLRKRLAKYKTKYSLVNGKRILKLFRKLKRQRKKYKAEEDKRLADERKFLKIPY